MTKTLKLTEPDFSDAEAEQRRDDALRRALTTPPKKHSPPPPAKVDKPNKEKPAK